VKALVLLAFVVQLALPVLAANELEQTITPITPTQEQRVVPLGSAGEQHVEALNAEGVQQLVGQGSKGPGQRAAETAGKVVLGVVAFATAVGATVAALLFL
jgi:hypothetical protein